MARKIMSGFAAVWLMALPAQAGDLNVNVIGIHSEVGAVMIGVYDSAERFTKAVNNAAHVGLLSDKGRLIGVTLRARRLNQGIGFLKLPPGRYAIIVYHDENDNGLLDKSTLGIPQEGYGFSNNARGFFSAPSFDAAAVTVGDAATSTSIALSYPRTLSPRRVGK
ncbi:MAG: DUF2141 domain-containing protein [Parvibaculum sp.]